MQRGRDPSSFRKNLNRMIGGGCLLMLVVGVGLTYVALRKKVSMARQDPLKVLDVLARAQKQFTYSDADKNGLQDPAQSLEMLARYDLIPGDWVGGVIELYRYEVVEDSRSKWALTATPLTKEPPKNHYRRDGFDVVRAALGKPAGASDRVVSSPRRR